MNQYKRFDEISLRYDRIGNLTETSLYNFRMRYYDPELCRFLSLDPEGYKDSVNLYQSFNQNPVNFTDPYGLQFRAGDSPYLTKKEEEQALKKIALSKEEWERLKETLKAEANDPDSIAFIFVETINEVIRNEREKECIRKLWQCMQRNFTLPGFPPGGGSPAGIMIAGGKAGEAFFKGVAYEEARKHALKTGRKFFWRFKVYKKWMGVGKLWGKTWVFLGIAVPYVGCLTEVVDCYLDVIPPESFSEKLLYFFIK